MSSERSSKNIQQYSGYSVISASMSKLPSLSAAPFPQFRIRCLLFQNLLFSDLCFEGVQQQLKAINWWGGYWNCHCPCYASVMAQPFPDTALVSFPLSFNRTSSSNKDLSTLLTLFSKWAIYFWSSSSWKEIPKIMGRFMMPQSTVLQWHQTSIS